MSKSILRCEQLKDQISKAKDPEALEALRSLLSYYESLIDQRLSLIATK